jgi:hypothetical protein
VHTDATATASAHALDALAYTAGEHIVFGSGRYAPDTISGRRLLIHELAHVVQQRRRMTTPDQDWQLDNPASASEQAADATVAAMERFPFPHHTSLDTQLAAMDPSVPVLQRAVSTWGGIWDTAKYNTLAGNAGVDIELHFKPGPPVEATSIGIIQKVTSKDKGAVVAVNPTVGARSLPAKSAGAGAHIDQLAQFRNPLFATGAGKAADKLWDTPTGAQWGQHGYRHTDSKGVVHQRDAVLKDTPQLPTHGANASQIFEDTALAITGEQTGATYGSVQWGWKTDAAGKFTRLPLSKVSDDVPSGTFKQAEGLWNKSKDSSGNALIKFYAASREFVQADNTPLVTDPTNPVKTEIAKLPKNTRVEVINKGFWEKFNKSDPKVKWWKISVTDGAAIGKTGWVQSSMLGSSKVAGAKSGTP